MKKVLLPVCLACLLAGCSTFRQHDPLPAVNQVDINRFMGTWYVVASVPTVLDKEAYNAVEMYERAPRGIRITYQFNAGAYDGPVKTYTSRAMIDNPGINSDWDVTWVWPFKADYRIIYLEPDYSIVVVGHPNRKNLWIMSRQKRIPDTKYSDLILFLQNMGYDVGKIRLVPQA
ncbi:MAG: lipocalin family protein [Oceanipulchritudo sp.]